MVIALLVLLIAAIIVITAVWKVHPVPVLLLGGFLFGVASGHGVTETVNLLSSGFGNTVKSIGIIIIAGTLIGAFMERRGALKIIADRIIALTGQKRTPLAMAILGYITSICIFCDSAFIILIGLWRKISTLAKLPLAVGTVALAMGLLASHCFIPPAAGPMAALSLMNADFSYVLLFGATASLAAAAAGYFYGMRFGWKEELSASVAADPAAQQGEHLFKRHWTIAFLPLAIPLVLIGGASLTNLFGGSVSPAFTAFMKAAGHPVPALGIGAILAIFLIGKCPPEELTADGLIGKTILDAANILVVTGAGGALGEVLKAVDFKPFLPERIHAAGAFAILVPLLFSAVLKTAQGSSSLAILTAAGMTVPMLDLLGLSSPAMRALACCAVCCGGIMVSHTNDSYFWIVVKFSGMNVRQGLKLQTGASLVSGLAAAATLLILACIFR